MFKQNGIIYYLIISILILSNGKTLNEADRHNNYKATFDCVKDGATSSNDIETAEDCFEESPATKWKCCYFEYKEGNNVKNGCMKVKKDDISDLNDLKYYVSKLSPNAVFTCRLNYLSYSFTLSALIMLILL